MSLRYPDYAITANTESTQATNKKSLFVISAGGDSTSTKDQLNKFGVFFQVAKKDSPLLALIDQNTHRLIKTITVDEYFGKETSSWKRLRQESTASTSEIRDAFMLRSGKQELKLIRTVAMTPDINLPRGQSLTITFSILADRPINIAAKFYGTSNPAVKEKNQTLIIEPVAQNRILLLHTTPTSHITITDRKQNFILAANPVMVEPNTLTSVFSLTVVGTTVRFDKQPIKQIENIIDYFNHQTMKPDFAAITLADKPSTTSGDTISYSIYYHNIGTAAGKDIVITNPIPEGTQYVENTAVGSGSSIELSRTGSNGPVNTIQWKFSDPIKPGEERVVQFRVKLI